MKKYPNLSRALAFLLVLALVLPCIRVLAQPEYQDEIQSWVKESGFWGLAAVFLLQVAQVIAAFVPGEPVELLAGVLYGALGGLALCLVGCVCASCLETFSRHSRSISAHSASCCSLSLRTFSRYCSHQ